MGKTISDQEKRRRKLQSQEDWAFPKKKPKHKKLEPYVRTKIK